MDRKLFSSWKTLVVCFLLVVLGTSCFAHSRSYVVPTNYGYGMIEKYSSWVRPYIVPNSYAYDPYYYGAYGTYPAYYGYNGYYPYYSGYAGNYGRPWSMGVVSVARLNVRANPGKSGGNVIGTLYRGERVWIYGQSGNWYYFRSADRPQIWGYAHVNCFDLYSANSYYSAVAPAYYPR